MTVDDLTFDREIPDEPGLVLDVYYGVVLVGTLNCILVLSGRKGPYVNRWKAYDTANASRSPIELTREAAAQGLTYIPSITQPASTESM